MATITKKPEFRFRTDSPQSQASPGKTTNPRFSITFTDQTAMARLAMTNVCGTRDSNGRFKFDLQVFSGSLDSQGFVVDAAVIRQIESKWFDKPYVASCEQLAGGLIQMMADQGAHVEAVIARVYNVTGHVDVEWQRGATLPEGPRSATKAEVRVGLNTDRYSNSGKAC